MGNESGESAAGKLLGEDKAEQWARNLADEVAAVLKTHPEADPDNVRHTLILLEKSPMERLATSLSRGRAFLSESELKFLRALVSRDVRFIVVGSFAAALQGTPVITQGVHLWFEDLSDPMIREALREVGASYVPPMQMNPPMFAGGGLELFDIVLRMDGLGKFAEELPHCIDVPIGSATIKVLSTPRILASKRAAGRDKDKLVISVLADSIATGETRNRRTTSGDSTAEDSK